jgi:phospholipase C
MVKLSTAQPTWLMAHLVDLKEYYHDLMQSSLPAVCWITPDFNDSEHSPEPAAPVAQGT